MLLKAHDNKLETNLLDAATQDFEIGDASVVIAILRNHMYEHKVRTMVQEYICNARDAHREIGRKIDFQVHVPTALVPVFKVRDFGPGISPERMGKIFIKYGSSTKRDNNTQTGGFGIGAKSAWSYTDSFTITTWLDGTQRVYIAHIGVNNQGRLDHISTTPSDQPNGTEIQVAVKRQDLEEFRDAVHRAIHFWDERPELQGVHEQPVFQRLTRIGNIEFGRADVRPNYLSDYRIAVIDGIIYPLENLGQKLSNWHKLTGLFHFRSGFAIHLPNGILELQASRESISLTEQSKVAAEKFVAEAAATIRDHVRDYLGSAKTTKEWAKFASELFATFESNFVENSSTTRKFEGYFLRNQNIFSDTWGSESMIYARKGHRRTKNGSMSLHRDERRLRDTGISLNNSQYVIEIMNDVGEGVTHLVPRLRKAIETQDGITVIRTGEKLAQKLMADFGFKNIEDLPFDPPKRGPKQNPKQNGEIRVRAYKERTASGYLNLNVTNPPQDLNYYVILNATRAGTLDPTDAYQNERIKELAISRFFGVPIYGIAEKDLPLIAGNAKFKHLSEYVNNFEPDQKMKDNALRGHLRWTYNGITGLVGELTRFREVTIEDQELVDFSTECNRIRELGEDHRPIPAIIAREMAKKIDGEKAFKEIEKRGKLLTAKYPLLQSIGSGGVHNKEVRNDIARYINSKHNNTF